MRLLLDQNLSPRGLQAADDDTVWRYAAEHGFAIISKDADFHERSFLLGHPPRVVWSGEIVYLNVHS